MDGLSTAEAAAASGYSVQQVRDLEAAGTLAPAGRAANGYRVFTGVHVRDLRSYRDLACAIGPVRARAVLREIRSMASAEAVELLAGLHAELAGERRRALAARAALRVVGEEASSEAAPTDDDAMTITELSDAVGVPASTLRFWEREGLLAPERTRTRAGSARRYPVSEVRAARIATELRRAGYRIPDTRTAVAALRELGATDGSEAALEDRIRAIGDRGLALLRAGSGLAELIADRREATTPGRPR